MADILVETRDISKEFSGVRVLNRISVQIRRGEILGLIGENGAGKSTFIKILSGTYTPTEGQIFFEGRPVKIHSPIVAREIGISTIPQEFNLINDLNVYENIFLGKEYCRGWRLDKKRMIERTASLLRELETDIDPEQKIDELSVAQKQMVEIAKAIAYDSKLLIMDEPTTVLTHHEIEVLFRLMERLREAGVTIIFISHKLREVKRICDRVMILRDGNFISLDPIADLDEQEMARRMVGRELTEVFPEKSTPEDEVVLEVNGLSVPGLLEDISFTLRKGEVLGFAGLVGAGRTEVAEALIGIHRKSAGEIRINGQRVDISSPIDAVKYGIAYLSEDRQGTGILTNFDITSNITLVSLSRYGRFIVNKAKELEQAEYYIKSFDIRAKSPKEKLEFLSGGNQQKVSLAKCLDPEPKILIIDEPTRGIDVSAKSEIYHFIQQLVASGISCILISSEMEEILGLCNRVVVMRAGKIAGILDQEELSEDEIMFLATGLKEGVA